MDFGEEADVMKHKRRIREGNPVVTIILYLMAGLTAFIALYPMYYILILSLSEPRFAATMKVYLYPKGLDLGAYEVIVKDSKMWRTYRNTILYVVPTTILMVITSTLAAYGLSCRNLRGRKFINMYLLIPMYFSGGMIPSFLLMTRLGLYDSPLSQILPACFSIWNIILVRSYFRTIPDALVDAARIDGAGIVQTLRNIYVPLGKPIFAVIAVYTIVGIWNSWFGAMLYLPHQEWQPLQLYLRRLLIEAQATINGGDDQLGGRRTDASRSG